MRRKKVLFLNLTTFSRTGGIEKFNRNFLRALTELENANKIYSNAHSLHDVDSDSKYYSPEKYTAFGKKRFDFLFQSFRKARRFDWIILGHINLAIIGCFIKLLLPGKKVIVVIHGIEVWEGLSPVKKYILERADKILSVSTFTKNKLVELENIKNKAFVVFPNTVDAYFPVLEKKANKLRVRQEYGIGASDFVLFTLTRLSSKEKYKGYDIVIKCMPEIEKLYPNVRYIIAGKHDDEEKARITNLVSELGLQNKVLLTGFIKDEEIASYYCMSDVFIMPSKKEGFGIVFIEALASGVPVIAGNIDGSVDALRGGELGTLVNPESEAEITQAILNCIRSNSGPVDVNDTELRKKTLEYFGFPKFKNRLENVLYTLN